jgi:hypothetical protein
MVNTGESCLPQELKNGHRRLILPMVLLTLLIGCVEGLYGRIRYSADAISYLDVTRAIHAGDWKLALNPLWSLGYPMLLSLLIPLFPAGPNGEWIAIHCANLIILAVTLLSYLYLVAAAIRCVIHREIAREGQNRALFVDCRV